MLILIGVVAVLDCTISRCQRKIWKGKVRSMGRYRERSQFVGSVNSLPSQSKTSQKEGDLVFPGEKEGIVQSKQLQQRQAQMVGCLSQVMQLTHCALATYLASRPGSTPVQLNGTLAFYIEEIVYPELFVDIMHIITMKNHFLVILSFSWQNLKNNELVFNIYILIQRMNMDLLYFNEKTIILFQMTSNVTIF